MKKLTVPLILFSAFIIAGIGVLMWWKQQVLPVSPNDVTKRAFVIEKGEAIDTMAKNLEDAGLIKNSIVFKIYIKKSNLERKIQAGDYILSPSMNLSQIIKQLTTGGLDVWITIREGLRSEEIASLLKKSLVKYNDSWIPVLKGQEGFLFPDTYLIPVQADVNTVISILRKNFDSKLTQAGLDPYGIKVLSIITFASLIERESREDSEKRIIAGILTNRLSDGMPLQVDATLQYIVGQKNGKWWLPPTGIERSIDSLYNTYKYVGLPPGPIANPGIESIKAAANPANTPYYYYLHEPNGTIRYAKTLAEHNRNIEKYLR